MTGSRLERLVRRDRLIVLAALGAIVLLAWTYFAWLDAQPMGAMTGMDMAAAPAGQPGFGATFGHWSGADFLTMFLMWAVMMVGMMTPSVAPMILIYARVARHAGERGQPFPSTAAFASGYLFAWIGFSAAATSLQWLLEEAALLTPAMRLADRLIRGALLVAAGVYQWTPLKHACLGQCRSPFQFIQDHGGFGKTRRDALLLGLRHGAYCVGCCWALMLLLFLGGVMNLLWIAALAAIVLAEKLLPRGVLLARAAGVVFILAGAALMVAPLWQP